MGELNFDEIEALGQIETGNPEFLAKVVNNLDLDVIRPRFDDYKTEAQRIAKDATELTITNQESLNIAVMLGGNSKKISKAIDLQRKQIIAEPSEFVKGVNAICNAITDSLDQAEATIKEKIRIHNARQEMERLERERKAREEAAALQRKLDAEAAAANKKAADEAKARAEEEAKAKGASPEEVKAEVAKAEESAAKNAVVAPTVVSPVVAEAPRVTRTEAGSSFSKHPWIHKIINPDLVPREYLMVDEKKIRDAVKMGVREIPGVEIKQETQINFRT